MDTTFEPCLRLSSAETTAPTAQPASSGLFGAKREIPKFERVRGGAGRTLTCDQTVMGSVFVRVSLPPIFFEEETLGSTTAQGGGNGCVSLLKSFCRERPSMPPG
jgi:hypothetical protein